MSNQENISSKKLTKNNQHSKRIRKVHFIYKYELLNKRLDITDAFENYNFNDEEIDELNELSTQYGEIREVLKRYFKKNWEWERLAPLERAILLIGAFELKKIDKGIVINEMVIYSKEYLLDDKYKFINAILQKVAIEYEK